MIVPPLADYARRVAVVDYGMSNLRSVANALEALGVRAEIVARPAAVEAADLVILPGVGAFGLGMRNLREGGWLEPLRAAVGAGKPLLGICLGMQLLATESEEHGVHAGLNFIPGRVRRLAGGAGLRVPHMGWNTVRARADSALHRGLKTEADFYFVHSFHFVPDEPGHGAGWCEYGESFVATVEKGRVFGVQFHPEKSHAAGLSLLKNFLTC